MGEKSNLVVPPCVPPDQVKAQLARILLSHPFRNSRRCQALLSYVVEAACEGRIDALKERIVGTAVFGREADYDTNQDAVVRNAAAEVRKRLAQYYMEPHHEAELRIELPSGSYVPDFRQPVVLPVEAGTKVVPVAGPQRRGMMWTTAACAGVAVVTLAAIAIVRLTGQSAPPPSELDRFWEPVVTARGAAQICIGQSRFHYYDGLSRTATPGEAKGTIAASKLKPMQDRFVWFGDAICTSRITGYLRSRGKDLRYRGALTTPYAELRGNPVVLIGAFNNEWNMRLTHGLRFTLVADTEKNLAGVRDSTRQASLPWVVSRQGPWVDTEEDYAIVTRLFDRDTERWVVAAGGITHFGTMMTGDFLSTPEYFREAVRSAPKDWQFKNMQVVLQTKIVGGTPGPPRVLAAHFW